MSTPSSLGNIMFEQTSFFDEPPPTFRGAAIGDPDDERQQTLFFAVQETAQLTENISAHASDFKVRHGLRGSLIVSKRRHVTLCAAAAAFGRDIPIEFIDAAKAAVKSIRHAPLDVRFDHVEHFKESGAVVLSGPDNTSVAQFSRVLAAALKRHGLTPHAISTPHMTLLYEKQRQLEDLPIEPVVWTATEFVLLISHVGQSRYDVLGRWPLIA
jgi:2'-5' RNA ligase